jgi:hypothetical protein
VQRCSCTSFAIPGDLQGADGDRAILNNPALAYNALGRSDDAIALHSQVFQTRKKQLGIVHPNTLGSLNLALAYAGLGRFDDAATLRSQVIYVCLAVHQVFKYSGYVACVSFFRMNIQKLRRFPHSLSFQHVPQSLFITLHKSEHDAGQ